MPSTYSTDLRIELIANGEQSGTWGQTTNTNLGTLIEDAIAGSVTVSITSANQALTALNGAADQARNASIVLTTTTAANFAVYVPPVPKLYVVTNSSLYTATIYCSTVLGNTTAAGAGVAVPAGKAMVLRSTGVNIVEQFNHVAGNLSVAGDQAVTGNQVIGGAQTVTGVSTFIASPLVPTAAATDDSTKAASTAFVRDIVPTGVIVMWSGSIVSIPTGWLICDGTNSTPDLRNRFIVGAGSTYAVAATGGSADAITVSHTHTGTTASNGAHTHLINPSVLFNQDNDPSSPIDTITGSSSNGTNGPSAYLQTLNYLTTNGAHTHTFTTDSTGSSGTNANLPPYYALAYIMKS
jgi:hypothetical protein